MLLGEAKSFISRKGYSMIWLKVKCFTLMSTCSGSVVSGQRAEKSESCIF